MKPDIRAFFDNDTFTVSYLVSDPATGKAAIIDPVLNFEARSGRTTTTGADVILAEAAARNLTIEWVLETHAHADHLSAADHLRGKTGAKIAIGENITRVQKFFGNLFHATDLRPDGTSFDRLLKDGERFLIGELEVEVLYTPGHTPACISYRIGDNVFVGDTLFMPDYGTARADFPGGDAAALYRSIQRILALPDETVLWMCHDYKAQGRDTFQWKTTVGEQRAKNIHVHDGVSAAEFMAMRNRRDSTLALPVLILPSIQVNIRAGAMPPPEEDGHSYLKLPINRL
jgi:glyoxylase-like metal-dependent hydrolase (beta-lactamase superfamily II)